MSTTTPPPKVLEQCILLATAQPSSSNNTGQPSILEATNILNNVRCSPNASTSCLELLHVSHHDACRFFACSTLQQCLSYPTSGGDNVQLPNLETRTKIREMLFAWLRHASTTTTNTTNTNERNSIPMYLRTKIAVLFALLIQRDYPHHWPSAFNDLHTFFLLPPQTKMLYADVYLRILTCIVEEVVISKESKPNSNCQKRNDEIKNVMRGFAIHDEGGTTNTNDDTITSELVKIIIGIYERYRDRSEMEQPLATLALSTLKGYISWIDVRLVMNPIVLGMLFSCISTASSMSSTNTSTNNNKNGLWIATAMEATECLSELVNKGTRTEEDKMVLLKQHLNLFSNLENAVNISNDDDFIDLCVPLGELVNAAGMQILPYWDDLNNGIPSSDGVMLTQMVNQLLMEMAPVFLQYFGYLADIDVCRAVLPLASRLLITLQKELTSQSQPPQSPNTFSVQQTMLPQLLHILHNQMTYPPNFSYDYQNDDDAEEQMFRFELRKFYVKLIQTCPQLTLEFTNYVLSQLPMPLSTCPVSSLEVALRLLFHYCEGMTTKKTSKTNICINLPNFRSMLMALHTQSDVCKHVHPEIIMLYQDITVRYSALLMEHPTDLLPNVLACMSGSMGLANEHARVRSRSCYLLLRLVKALGVVMRPFVETAVGGITGLLSNKTSFPLQPDDSLYFSETVGLLLGSTGLHPTDQTFSVQVLVLL